MNFEIKIIDVVVVVIKMNPFNLSLDNLIKKAHQPCS